MIVRLTLADAPNGAQQEKALLDASMREGA